MGIPRIHVEHGKEDESEANELITNRERNAEIHITLPHQRCHTAGLGANPGNAGASNEQRAALRLSQPEEGPQVTLQSRRHWEAVLNA